MKKLSLIQQIIMGLLVGVLAGVFFPNALGLAILGNLFVGALKSVAPLLVFFIVLSALAQHKKGQNNNMKTVIALYLLGTFGAAVVAVCTSFIFPVKIILGNVSSNDLSAPEGIGAVINTLFMNLVDNPVHALAAANYIGILFWAIIFGVALKQADAVTKNVLRAIADATTTVVKWVIQLASIGIMGLVYQTVSENGLNSFASYGQLLAILVGAMLFVAFVMNPLIVYVVTKENPYPLVWKCLTVSGVTAFFTRSSAANIPVNMQLCRELGLEEEAYSVSIPLGATINMAGAAITISVLTLAAVNTLGIEVEFFTALALSVLAAISACGASGVAGGSLLLIPVACSLFGISNDIAMQVVGVGFIIGVIQDSFETALNSSTDVLFTAAAEIASRKK